MQWVYLTHNMAFPKSKASVTTALHVKVITQPVELPVQLAVQLPLQRLLGRHFNPFTAPARNISRLRVTHAGARTHTHACMHAHAHACSHAARARTHTRTHTHTHARTHAHTHTHTRNPPPRIPPPTHTELSFITSLEISQSLWLFSF